MKDLNNDSLKTMELDDDELFGVTGAGSEDTIRICCNPNMGGCGNIEMISMSAKSWRCSCGKLWTLDG